MITPNKQWFLLGSGGLALALVSAPLTSVHAGGEGGDEVVQVNDRATPPPAVADPKAVLGQARAAYPLTRGPVGAGSRADADKLVLSLENARFCGSDENHDRPPAHSTAPSNPKLLPAAAAVIENLVIDGFVLERMVAKIGRSTDPLAPRLLIHMYEHSEAIVAPSIVAQYGDEALAMSTADLVKVIDNEVERSAASLRRKLIRASANTTVEEYLIGEGLDDHQLLVRVAAAQRAVGFGELFLTELSVLCASEEVFCQYYDGAAYR